MLDYRRKGKLNKVKWKVSISFREILNSFNFNFDKNTLEMSLKYHLNTKMGIVYRDLILNHYRGSRERHHPDGKDIMIVGFWMSLTILAIVYIVVLILIFKQKNTIVKRTDRSVEQCSTVQILL